MASTTRGSIKISTANGIGAALVDVLGGEGYAPDKWEESINICGIHAADIGSALENIEEDAGTGTERGSILLSTANAIGATLNKKFNTSRGFKPKEWASAASKLEPLPERTASGAIAHIEDGADGVPLKNWLVTLPASLDGYTEVNGLRSGKNFLDDTILNLEQGSINGSTGANENANNRVRNASAIPFPYDEIVLSYTWTIPSGYKVAIRPYDANGNFVQPPAWALAFITQLPQDLIGQGITQMRFVLAKTDNTAITPSDMANIGFQIEVGSTATAYEAYTAPTQYTASLGRTIYGGTADIVTGEGEATYKGFNLGALTWSGGIIGGQMWCWYVDLSAEGLKLPTNSEIFNGVCDNYSPIRYNGVSTNANTIALRNNGYLYVNNGSDTVQPAGKVTIALATPTDFTFTPITPTPETALGVNNFWADEGESAVTYRKDLDIPDPVPGNLLGMNNGNNEENEEESEG